MTADTLAEVAELLYRRRNAIDENNARVIGPVDASGHLGEWIASS